MSFSCPCRKCEDITLSYLHQKYGNFTLCIVFYGCDRTNSLTNAVERRIQLRCYGLVGPSLHDQFNFGSRNYLSRMYLCLSIRWYYVHIQQPFDAIPSCCLHQTSCTLQSRSK
ncbi:hypothetical protein D1007_32956 [Hordeum vulgare]|nr:hypothetical protein D1007_32956 [Hordeum vulgare]